MEINPPTSGLHHLSTSPSAKILRHLPPAISVACHEEEEEEEAEPLQKKKRTANKAEKSAAAGKSAEEAPQKGKKKQPGASKSKSVKEPEENVPLWGELIVKPRTAKDRQRNAEIFRAHNRNHEDDVFAGQQQQQEEASDGVQQQQHRLLNFSEDTDSENDISIHSARTPVEKYLVKHKTSADRTPALLAEPSPESPKKQLQTYSFVHTRIEENKRLAREISKNKKKTFSLALTEKVKSQAAKSKLMEQSCVLIQNLTRAQNSQALEDDEDDWLSEDDEVDHNSRLDEQAGIISAISLLQ